MSATLIELSIIFVLLLANGIFSMAEIAIVSSRKARLRQRADGGDASALVALDLAASPNAFLATVQIGITLIGVVAAAFSGATLAERLADPMKAIPELAPYATRISFAVVVTTLTFCTLVIGELLPKRLGLDHSESIACALAGPMRKLSVIASPLVTLLGWATDALLRIFHLRPTRQEGISREEVSLLVREGLRAGVFHPSEPAMIEGVMALDRIPVQNLMTPRTRMVWIHSRDSHDAVARTIAASGHTTYPVYEGNRDHVLGIVSLKSIYARLADGSEVRVQDLVVPPLVVPASISAHGVLEKFRQAGRHVALVADEFGAIIGMVSVHDIMEAVLGELPSAEEPPPARAVLREDGSWLVDGMMDVAEFERTVADFPLHPAGVRDYQTFAGFVVKHLGHVPREGDSFVHQNYRVHILDLDGHRVDKVLLVPAPRVERDTLPPGDDKNSPRG